MSAAQAQILTPLRAHESWRRRLRVGLPDAARMLLAAMLAYVLAHALHLREVHWAVLSALITGRAQAGGTARAGAERLLATIAGAALAAAAAAARAWQVDGALLLFGVLAPLCLLATLKPAYRTAPIAALIVLSSGPIAGAGPLGTAIERTTEIALGALASVAVSLAVFPSRARAKVDEHGAAILHRLAQWLRLMPGEHAAGEAEKLREELRGELRELTVLVQTSGWRRRREEYGARVLRALMALHGDVGFLARTLARQPLRIDAGAVEFTQALQALAGQMDRVATASANRETLPAADEVRAALRDAIASQPQPVAVFLLRSIGIALGQAVAALGGAGAATPALSAAAGA